MTVNIVKPERGAELFGTFADFRCSSSWCIGGTISIASPTQAGSFFAASDATQWALSSMPLSKRYRVYLCVWSLDLPQYDTYLDPHGTFLPNSVKGLLNRGLQDARKLP